MTDFEALIAARKACRICVERSPGKLRSCAEFAFDPAVVSHWEQWLGHRNPKLLAVGQDFGNIAYFVRHRGRDDPRNKTNRNLYELLTAAGIALAPPDRRDRDAPVFLTNAILCIKEGKMNGAILTSWIDNCSDKHLLPLVRLLRPPVVVGMGNAGWRAVRRVFGLADAPTRISRAAGRCWITAEGTRVFAVGHPGPLGLINRPWPQQLADWRQIGAALTAGGDMFVMPPAAGYDRPRQRKPLRGGPVTMRTNFAVGDMTIHRVVEQEYGFTPIFEFLPSLTRECFEENRSWLEPAACDPKTGNAVLCFQSYVVKTPHHNILVDACIGNNKSFPLRPTWNGKTDGAWMAALKAAGLGVEDIDFVMCTHLHGDHVGWNTRLDNGRWVPTFPKARYLFSRKEYEYWTSGNVPATFSLDPINESVLPVVEANKAELVTSDHALNDHIRLMPTPGHTPDHFAVCAGKGGDRAVFTGDLIHSPIQARYPELVMRVDYDHQQAAATRRRFLERYCDSETLCCTMHFPSPSVGHIKRWGDGFRLETAAE